MGLHPLWTAEDDETLRARFGRYTVAELAMHFNRSMGAIEQRASNLGLLSRAQAADADTGAVETMSGDQRFILAMCSAIRAGRERPPRVGIDTRPCTRAPIFIERGQAPTIQSSYMADL